MRRVFPQRRSETGSPRTVRFSPNAPGPSETPEFGLPQLSLLELVGVDGLLTGCDQVWVAVGRAMLDGRSIAPVICDFWDVDRHSAKFPYVFESFLFQRFISACHLRQRLAPALMITSGGRR
jgi:hypothetical protein